MHKWRRSLRRKQSLFPQRDWFTPEELRGNLRALTPALVLRHTEFGSLDNYLDGYSIAGDRLADLRVPATILTAMDDPVIPIADFRALQLPAQIELDVAATAAIADSSRTRRSARSRTATSRRACARTWFVPEPHSELATKGDAQLARFDGMEVIVRHRFRFAG